MTDPGIRSEQEERLELADQPAEDDPRPWRDEDPDHAREADGFPPGHQVSPPNEGPQADDEPDEIAQDRGTSTVTGAEQQALHIETDEEPRGDD